MPLIILRQLRYVKYLRYLQIPYFTWDVHLGQGHRRSTEAPAGTFADQVPEAKGGPGFGAGFHDRTGAGRGKGRNAAAECVPGPRVAAYGRRVDSSDCPLRTVTRTRR